MILNPKGGEGKTYVFKSQVQGPFLENERA